MFYYLIQTFSFQLFFLIAYDLFFRKETFFNWNRIYLIGTAILSFILPIIKIDKFSNVISQDFIINLPQVVIGSMSQSSEIIAPLDPGGISVKSTGSWEVLYYLGLLFVLLLFFIKLFKLYKLIVSNPKSQMGKLTLIHVLSSNAAFSFFQYVFLGELLSSKEKETILQHEIVHIKQWHSVDSLFFEILRILFWFNPLVYMYQNRIITLHEYIADAEAIKSNSKTNYYQSLLSQFFETKNISFINPFFKKSLIKKRIVMLQKSKSKQVYLFKYVLLIPMVFGMLVYTSCLQADNTNDTKQIVENKIKKETKLIEKIKAVRHQIQKQGNLNNSEERGLALLLKLAKDKEFNQQLVNEVKNYIAQESKSVLTQKISSVFEQIQIQGNISDEEVKELKKLLILTSDNGFADPFFKDIIKYVDIPFAIIDQPPVFPGCENLSANEQKKCMSKNISMHVNNNFNVKLANELNLTGRQRINVIFKIDNEGNIVDIRSRAAHPGLETEALRVINTLPKFIPGEHKGEKVNVPYSLPIIFEIAAKE